MDMNFMTMYFYQARTVHFIFHKWDTMMGSWWAYGTCLISCLVVGFLVEALSVFGNRLEAKNKFAVTMTGQTHTS